MSATLTPARRPASQNRDAATAVRYAIVQEGEVVFVVGTLDEALDRRLELSVFGYTTVKKVHAAA